MAADKDSYARDLLANPRLIDVILARKDVFPRVPAEPERFIHCSPENADRAISLALGRAVMLGQLWKVEIEE
jgi:hypothetical protein